MSLILNIETSSTNCSVSISKNGKLIDCIEKNSSNFSHSQKLHIFISEITEKNKISLRNFDAVSVGIGPGSYTGLRIGLAAAKGICYALDIPLISISSLENLITNIDFNGILISTIDARRDEVYSSIYNNKKEIIREEMPEIINSKSFLNYSVDEKILIVGNGQFKCKELIELNSNFNWNEKILIPSAANMGKIAHKKYNNNAFEDIAYCEPKYLKEFKSNKG
jgi:tRNA threonylcarbamoyladenosine biosynthesis protein TsaB